MSFAELGIRIDATSADRASESLARMQKASDGAESAIDRLAVASGDANKEIVGLLTKIEQNTRATADNTAAMIANVQVTKQIKAAVNENTVAIGGTTDALGKATKAHKEHGGAAYYNRLQMQEFGHVGRAFVDSIAAGIPITRVLAFEGSRLIQAFSYGEGGLAGLFGRIGTAISKILDPAKLVFGGIAGLVAGTALELLIAEKATDRLQIALNGLGRASGLTVDYLREIAKRSAAGAGVSETSATSLIAGFVGTGRIGAGVSQSLAGLSKQYGLATEQSTSAAGAQLANIFADPAKGADELDKKIGLLDAATRESIRSLEAQGNIYGAQRELIGALSTRLAAMTDTTWTAGNAWRRLGEYIGNALGALQNFVQTQADPTLGQKLEEALRRARAAQNLQSQDQSVFPQMGGTNFVPLGEAANRGGTSDVAATQTAAVLSDTADRIERAVYRQENAALANANTQRVQDQSKVAQDIVSKVLPQTAQRRGMQDEAKALDAALKIPGVIEKLGSETPNALHALDNLRNGVAALGQTAAQTVAEDAALTQQATLARTATERITIEANKTYADVLRTTRDATLAAAEATAKWNEAMAESSKRAEDSLRAAQEAAGLVGLLPLQRLIQEANNKYAEQIRNATAGTYAPPVATPIYAPPVVPRAPFQGAPVLAPNMSSLPASTQSDVAKMVLSAQAGQAGYEAQKKDWTAYQEALAAGKMTGGAQLPVPSAAMPSGAPYSEVRPSSTPRLPVNVVSTYAQERTTTIAAGIKGLGEVQIEQANRQLDDQNKLLEVNAADFLKTTQVKAENAAKQAELNRLNDAGINSTTVSAQEWNKLAAAVDLYAQKAGVAAKRTEEVQKAQHDLITVMDDVRSTASDVLSTFTSDLIDGKSAMTALSDAAKSLANDLVQIEEKNLLNSLLGPSGTTGQDSVFGSALANAIKSWGGAGAGGPGDGSTGTNMGFGTASHAAGGLIRGPGTGSSDSIVARLSTGEFIVNAAATSRHVELLHAINDNRLNGYAGGGVVSSIRPMAGGDASLAPIEVHVHNAPTPLAAPPTETRDLQTGQRKLHLEFRDMAVNALSDPGAKRALGIQQRLQRR